MTAFFYCPYILAVFAISIAQLAGIIQIFLGLSVLLHFRVYHRRYGNQTNVVQLSYTENIGWQLGVGQSVDLIEIQASSIVTTFLIIVHYRIALSNKRLHSLVCFKDALSPREFKQLIVQLKISGLQEI